MKQNLLLVCRASKVVPYNTTAHFGSPLNSIKYLINFDLRQFKAIKKDDAIRFVWRKDIFKSGVCGSGGFLIEILEH